ncbi:N-acetyl-D-glucosamine kinase [Condylostylus longicornis]|uniref:N-acetyl-D-glucosamine kinase n=1 Tax=Condylostylus longicornis TaxID=2530218 RepID=UPI00244DBB15|nr:N-acetyl-D-glucosamine kinase [Condylostylus longicornis]XP_055384793.1 N-acetyl-D-glucosamine kinase [Condylostylus longicornis]XP_055384794.1 N-acetyl-D-glucosamine kinase [Condylostylus longicornis]
MKYYGGIEGGATHSKLIICNEEGEILSTVTGLGTNHWISGIPEVAKRIADMIEKGKKEAKINQTTKLISLGLSLSGCEQEATNSQLRNALRSKYPDIAEHYVVCSDTVGSIAAVSAKGGLVLISGTGSNALLRNPDGSVHGCGGWGNFLGDEGSAWWVSHRAIKIIFDDMDNFEKSPYPIDKAWELTKEHFSLQNRRDILDHCYAKFDKPFFASLCKKLALAAENDDKLCRYLFNEAGRLLARFVIALLPKVQKSLVDSGDLRVLCVGSVWLSWKLMREGFINELNNVSIDFGLQMVTPTNSIAMGPVYLGVDGVNHDFPRNYEANYKLFYTYKQHKQNGCI